MKSALNRRTFLSLAGLGAGTVAVSSLFGCAPAAKVPEDESEANGAETVDWLGEDPAIGDDQLVSVIDTDLLIVGAGNAGIAAAATAADLGIDFVLCEKASALPSPRHWVGAINTKYHKEAGLEVDEKKLLNELTRYASGKCDQSVWKVWIEESAEMVDFFDKLMKEQGMTLFLDTEGYDHETGGTDFYVPPIQHIWYDPAAAVPSLMSLSGMMSPKNRNMVVEEYIGSKGYGISYQHDLVKINREEGGRVTGAVFSTPDGYVQVNAAKGVVLATGGYAADPVMMKALSPGAVAATSSPYFVPTNTGGGIKAAIRIGATKDIESAPMLFDRGIVPVGVDTGYIDEGADARFGGDGTMLPIGSLPFMKVNRNGKRFANESCPYDFMCFAASKQPGGVWCTVMDANAAEDAKRFSVVGCAKIGTELLQGAKIEEQKLFLADCVKRGLIVKADTLEELADAMQLPKEAFLAEVEKYNQMFANQKDDDFGKEAYRLSAIKDAPFYGYWSGGLLLTTLDGLSINENMQVLDESKNVIEGLYAAGDCSGSLFSGNYPEYLVGCACGRTLTEGRHAVRFIAGDLA